jgi:tetratricopeptide (TPR) repeat protein
VTFFKRMFSADYRRAVAAEAAGDYSEAARAYALAGEHAKVAEMHLLRAERAPSPEAKLSELRAAVRWADPDELEGRAARRRIARALFTWAKQAGVVSDSDRAVVREAAALFAEAGDHAGAGECHELIGEEMQAAEAYQRAGDLEKLETVLSREEQRRKKTHRVVDAYDEYQLQLQAGERDQALTAIRAAVEAAGDADKAGYRQKLEDLESRLLAEGKAMVKAAGQEILYVGELPLVIGRESTCQVSLRDAGISRRHAEIVRQDRRFLVRDLHSKNGTTLQGVRLEAGGALPLDDQGRGEGTIGIGEHCEMRYRVEGERIHLEVVRGLDRGLRIQASLAKMPIAEVAELLFVDGRPRLTVPGGAFHLNGVHAGAPVQLIRGDKVEIGDVTLEVG